MSSNRGVAKRCQNWKFLRFGFFTRSLKGKRKTNYGFKREEGRGGGQVGPIETTGGFNNVSLFLAVEEDGNIFSSGFYFQSNL